jgi:hypothetical protein
MLGAKLRNCAKASTTSFKNKKINKYVKLFNSLVDDDTKLKQRAQKGFNNYIIYTHPLDWDFIMLARDKIKDKYMEHGLVLNVIGCDYDFYHDVIKWPLLYLLERKDYNKYKKSKAGRSVNIFNMQGIKITISW